MLHLHQSRHIWKQHFRFNTPSIHTVIFKWFPCINCHKNSLKRYRETRRNKVLERYITPFTDVSRLHSKFKFHVTQLPSCFAAGQQFSLIFVECDFWVNFSVIICRNVIWRLNKVTFIFNNTMKINSRQNNASANFQEALKIILNYLK